MTYFSKKLKQLYFGAESSNLARERQRVRKVLLTPSL